jgi:DNA ligase-associated metallophosphoesterase
MNVAADSVTITLAGEALMLLPSGATYWPARGMLVVADLHLCKSEHRARRWGAMLPPYETRETLSRLDAEIAATQPATVLCLGDSFDDTLAAEALTEDEALWLTRLQAGRRWIWVAGNHDPAPLSVGGSHVAEHRAGPLTFRHIARRNAGADDPVSDVSGEVSGHYHPKLRLALGGTGVSRPAFLCDARRLILPAFGAYTGGLSVLDPALSGLLSPEAQAVLTGRPMACLPLAAVHSAAASRSGSRAFRSPAASARSR